MCIQLQCVIMSLMKLKSAVSCLKVHVKAYHMQGMSCDTLLVREILISNRTEQNNDCAIENVIQY